MQKELSKKKKTNFIEFAEQLNFNSNPKRVWQTCKILKNKWTKVNPSHTSQHHQEDNEITIALDKISPPWVPTDPSFIPNCNDNDFLDTPFNFLEFNIALESKNNRSSCGLDGIDYETIKMLPITYKLVLVDIFNEMFDSHSYPDDWKNSYVHFIKKSDGKKVRPISLTSCTCKLFETMLKNKLQWYLETNNLLPATQSGFRKGQSTTDNLTNLSIKIEESFSKKRDLMAAFLDVEGAFDNVNIYLLLIKLAEVGCSSKIIQFIKFLTFERFIYTNSLKNQARKVYKGVPQGGVLSPLLYIIYVSLSSITFPKVSLSHSLLMTSLFIVIALTTKKLAPFSKVNYHNSH